MQMNAFYRSSISHKDAHIIGDLGILSPEVRFIGRDKEHRALCNENLIILQKTYKDINQALDPSVPFLPAFEYTI